MQRSAHDELIGAKSQQFAECLFNNGGCFAGLWNSSMFSSLRGVIVTVLFTGFNFMINFF